MSLLFSFLVCLALLVGLPLGYLAADLLHNDLDRRSR